VLRTSSVFCNAVRQDTVLATKPMACPGYMLLMKPFATAMARLGGAGLLRDSCCVLKWFMLDVVRFCALS
jgi:hypothetical protein